MKKAIFYITFIVLSVTSLYAQTDGLSYQAVIIDPTVQELPGVNATGNILPNRQVTLRFTIINAAGNSVYRETQQTQTDAFGMINVIIGKGQPVGNRTFKDIFWDGTRKDLQVEVNLNGQYRDLGKTELTFIPYALHRDILATGDFTLNGIATLGSNLVVDGTTNLNDNLSVNNESSTTLSGTLQVAGVTNLDNTLNVNNESTVNATGALNVNGATNLNNTLTVADATNLNSSLDVNNASPTNLTGTLTVEGITNFNNNVNINNGSELNINGPLIVNGLTTLGDDLTVEGDTNLNNSLFVNNNSPTSLSGSLTVVGESILENSLRVDGVTNLESALFVNNESPSNLSGSLRVDGETNLNSSLSVNNGSPTFLSGTLEVQGSIGLNNNLTVQGTTNLNGAFFVNNNEPSNLSGTLDVGGNTNLNGTLVVEGETLMNNNVTVANASTTLLTGTLDVEGITTLNNTLDVTNNSATTLTGTLNVDGISTLNNTLNVTNAAETNLSGALNVEGITSLNNDLNVTGSTELSGDLTVAGLTNLNDALNVTNASPTNLSGSLTVEGISNLNNALNIAGVTTIDNDLTVTGNTFLGNLNTETINIESDNANHIATFTNNNAADGDGILIKLGKNHGAWTGSGDVLFNLPNPIPNTLTAPLNVLKGILENPGGTPNLSPTQIIQFTPALERTSSLNLINNLIFSEINTRAVSGSSDSGLKLPIAFPDLNVAARQLLNGSNFPSFPGVTVPFVNISIPGWSIPNINLPNIPIPIPSGTIPNPAQYIPRLPINLPTDNLQNVLIANIPTTLSPESLTKENEYITFQDKDGRKTGTIRAQSVQDFRDNTILDNVYVLNLLSNFVGIDLVDGITAGAVGMTNLIDEFNKIGVEYSSGNGDYAEWLERLNETEFLSAGDIVGVIGGKVTKNLENAEQIMVVSHRPIILGNTPDDKDVHLGNTIAFMGQVPVKVLGPVKTGDYIVASQNINGYGKAISAHNMTANDFKFTVGRSWEENLNEGPKMVNTVVGVHNGDWVQIIQKIIKKQQEYEVKYNKIEAQISILESKANQLLETHN